MYSVSAYGQMITDRVRMQAYERALRQAIQPGATVLDVGTGTGIMALLACQMGAGHVDAIEPADVIQLARGIADVNGFADRITFIQDLSTRVSLPRLADVIVSDIRGVLPLLGHHIPAIEDARKRLLAPQGLLIPQRVTLWAAPVNAPETFARFVEPWDTNGYRLDMQAARGLVLNSWTKARLKPEQLLGKPQLWATLDYTRIEDANVGGALTWIADQEGTLHGLCVWFDTTLISDIGFSNAPGAPELIYGNAFFPLENPVQLSPGDMLSIELRADLVGDDYLWQWNTQVVESGSERNVKAGFRQSTFLGVPLTLESLRKRASVYAPSVNVEGQMLHFTLGQMMAGTALGSIAEQLTARFPKRFQDVMSALSYAGELSTKYG